MSYPASLVIHPMISNHAHINWGEAPAPGSPPVNVDQWHLDSVSHVIIILMSDMSLSLSLVEPGTHFRELSLMVTFHSSTGPR